MTASPHSSTLRTRLKIERLPSYARRHAATPPPITHGFAGSSTECLTGSESGPSAPGGHISDTPTTQIGD